MTFISQVNSCTITNNSLSTLSSKSSLSLPANNDNNAPSTNSQKNTPNTNCYKNNTLRILIHATMQLLTSPPVSPSSSEEEHCVSPSSESSYFSFPEYEEFDYDDEIVVDTIGSRGEIESMIVQMEKFDEMLVNGVRVNS
ncbi:hypothetical protein Glove_174g49 [Diversispora epigaea]|uniref:Uncharacterized protein n=1 Tax=Diversispora epigaea TaxID=1348612 RepID=A0A397ITQ0_9GLOM|nr:hypothetical protein Glove_174g49 [Diversispora epigaea]